MNLYIYMFMYNQMVSQALKEECDPIMILLRVHEV